MIIETIKYRDFKHMLRDIIPGGELKQKLTDFIYRGESTNSYKLLPSALRPENEKLLFSYIREPIYDHKSWCYWQIRAEYELIRNFYKEANKVGLEVPYIKEIHKDYIFPYAYEHIFNNNLGSQKWLYQDVDIVAALAQHYGVPTRLLDWSFDIFIALFFASVGAMKRRIRIGNFNDDDHIVIWALKAGLVQFLNKSPISPISLRFVVPPYKGNPNLHAQKGILSYWEVDNIRAICMPTSENQLTDHTPLDELIRNYANDFDIGDTTILYKLELPVNECTDVFFSLLDLGYSSSALFPGYRGVAKHMSELNIAKELNPEKNHGLYMQS